MPVQTQRGILAIDHGRGGAMDMVPRRLMIVEQVRVYIINKT